MNRTALVASSSPVITTSASAQRARQTSRLAARAASNPVAAARATEARQKSRTGSAPSREVRMTTNLSTTSVSPAGTVSRNSCSMCRYRWLICWSAGRDSTVRAAWPMVIPVSMVIVSRYPAPSSAARATSVRCLERAHLRHFISGSSTGGSA